MPDIYLAFFMFFLDDFGYHWSEYARCQFPDSGLECIVSADEMKVLNFFLDKANEDTPCYENRFFPVEPGYQDSCPEQRG